MQETHQRDLTRKEADKMEKLRKEMFTAQDSVSLNHDMDSRLKELSSRGEILSRRFKVEPYELPGLMRELAVEAMEVKNKSRKRAIKKQIQKILDSI